MVIMYKYHEDGSLPQNGEVFVFGSNLAGIHGAGAAFAAHKLFGAKWGMGIGHFENSYAIPTKDTKIETLPLQVIIGHIKDFVDYTNVWSVKEWFVTRVGCGLAGYEDYQIAPHFRGAKNCTFAEQWRPYLDEGHTISRN
jgi:hypothetical protein